MRPASTRALRQEGTGGEQEQRIRKRRVLANVGNLKVLGRISVFSKSKQKSLTCFKLRGDMLRFSSLDDCSNRSLEKALVEGKVEKSSSVKRPLQ